MDLGGGGQLWRAQPLEEVHVNLSDERVVDLFGVFDNDNGGTIDDRRRSFLRGISDLGYSRQTNSATPRLFEPSPVNDLLGRFRPIWASRSVRMAIFELGMLSTAC